MLGVMLAKSRLFGACVVSVALLVAGCSSGGGNHATPTTTIATTSTATTTTTVSPSHVVAKLGPCPATLPAESLIKLPSVVQSLRQTLVPIAASNVRVCGYGGSANRLVGSSARRLSDAGSFSCYET